VITLLAIIIYSMGNIGVFLYYRSDRRAEFNPWLHFIFPLLSTISLLWVGYKSVNPLPAPPVKYAPFVVAGWAVFALIVTFLMSRTGKERWIRESGEIIEEVAPHTEQPVISGANR
jgi:amino acid transporter